MAEEAIAKARAIALKLSGGIGSDLGKRKNRWEEQSGGGVTTAGPGLGAIKKKKVYVPVREHPGINFLGLLIGPRGATQKQLQENSGAKIIIRGRGSQKDGAVPSGHADDDDELHISIEGTDESIEKALQEIEPLLFNPEQALKLKQEQLKNLAEMNGSSPSSSGFGAIVDSIYVAGNKVMSSVISAGDDYQVELKVPNAMVGFVIGKGGEHIQKLQSQTGAHVQIAREQDMKPGDTHRSIVLKGNPDAVAECKRMIDEVISSRQQNSVSGFGQPKQHTQREMDHSFIVKVKVPNNKVGIIIGKGGATIKTIQERTGAQVQIPSVPDEDNPNLRTLCIGGDTLESVEAAQQEITVALQQSAQAAGAPLGSVGSQYPAMQMPQTSTSYVLVPDDRVGVIIGKAGATIKELQSRTRVKISIPQAADAGSNPPVRTCSISGTHEAMSQAKYEIEKLLQNHAAGVVNSVGPGVPYGSAPASYGQQQQQHVQQYGQQQQQNQQQTYVQQPQYDQHQPHHQIQQQQHHQQNPQQNHPQYSQQQYGQHQTYGQQQPHMQPSYGQMPALASALPTNPYPTYADPGPVAPPEPAVVAPNPTAYYNDFWLYVSYYGEAAARAYYTQWAPPEGSLPPAGTPLPAAPLPHEHVPEPVGEVQNYKNENNNPSVRVAEVTPPIDPAIAAAYEEFKIEYKKWYDEHGKASGASPNPPPPQ